MQTATRDIRHVRCKICTSSKLDLVDTAYRLVHCADCGLVFAEVIYSNSEFEDLYKTLYKEGGGYDLYFSAAFKQLKAGKTPWIGFERRAVLKHILRQRAKVIGEIGASMGMTAQFLKDQDVEYFGVEFDEKTATMAQELGFNISCGDHSRLKERRSGLDAVIAFEVLEHVPDIRECFEDIRECLKPSGLFGFTVPNYDSRLNEPRPDYLGGNAPPVHLNFWTSSSLERTLKVCGFRPQLLKVRRRPNFDLKNVSSTLGRYLKASVNRYHGPTIVCVAQKDN